MHARLAVLALFVCAGASVASAQRPAAEAAAWQVGTPIVTYFAGPPMSEAVARQMAEGGFNVVWCGEQDLDLVQRHALRGMLRDGLLSPASLETPERRAQLDALIQRVAKHPAMYSYYILDEPSAAAFPALGQLLAYLRQRDPQHMAYINLFPTYANNDQLGTTGDTVTAYREHLRQYIEIVKPQLVSYDHYQFHVAGDTDQYFLNLSMIRKASQDAGVPFLNIVQACSWTPSVRVPQPQEMRYLVYTTLAYGAQGISYYVYSASNHKGGMIHEDGTPTEIYRAVSPLNRQFVAIASELQPLRSQAVYHVSFEQPGCEPLPENAAFRPDPPNGKRPLLLGYFGAGEAPSHVVVVNLDYRNEAAVVIAGPGDLEQFDAAARTWSAAGGARAELKLPPGGGQLLRIVDR